MKRSFLFLGFFAFFSSLALADEVPGDILDRADYDPNTPYYQIMPPSMAFGFRAAVINFPTTKALGSVYELYGEKLFHFQKIGILSGGLHLGTAPFSGTHYENIKYGGVLRYQLHVMSNQIIVPTAALVYDGFRLKNGANASVSFSSAGIMLGALLNLGFFDSETARQGHESLGLLRSYLSFEMRPLSVSNSAISVSGSLWYMGIRLETE